MSDPSDRLTPAPDPLLEDDRDTVGPMQEAVADYLRRAINDPSLKQPQGVPDD